MKRIQCEQGSIEWLQARMGIPTASEFDALITPLNKVRTGDGVDTYLAKKLAERWTGAPMAGWSGGLLEQGHVRESEAIPWYEFREGVTVERVGFITTDDGRVGCSPDGLLGTTGIEIKCPEPHTHVRYLMDGELPKEYRAQVQGSMFVTGAESWRFLSYCRGFPALLLDVSRDKATQTALAEALTAFLTRLDEGWAMLVERNGGEPVRRVREVRTAPKPTLSAESLDFVQKQEVDWQDFMRGIK